MLKLNPTHTALVHFVSNAESGVKTCMYFVLFVTRSKTIFFCVGTFVLIQKYPKNQENISQTSTRATRRIAIFSGLPAFAASHQYG
jgi:hypothetical protein